MLSKLHESCNKCPYMLTCEHKVMVGIGQLQQDLSNDILNPIINPILRETINININGDNVTVYKDEIEKAIYDNLYKSLYKGLLIDGGKI